MRHFTLFLTFQLFISLTLVAQEKASYLKVENIPYYEQVGSEYQEQQCVIDIYYPESVGPKPVVVWFHGGGLTGGRKEIPEYLMNKDLVVVGVGYRLSPNVAVENIIQDAAKAVSYIYQNIGKYNGDPEQLFVSGHSAGGYLALMIGLDERYLKEFDMETNKIAGIISFSGQAITHFTVRKERGIEETQPTIDKYAPLFWVRKDAPPITLITGDREKEMLGRYEENAYLKRMLNIAGHDEVRLIELQGYGHDMAYPAFPLLVEEIKNKGKE